MVISRFVEWTLLQCYRRTGRWPETAARLFPEGVPSHLQRRGDALHDAYTPEGADREAEAAQNEEIARIKAAWT